MNTGVDLQNLERNLFRTYYQDGLLELCLGAAFVQLGILIFLLPMIVGGLVGSSTVWLFIFFGLKGSITRPRLGYVEFSKKRQQRLMNITLVIIAIIAVSVLGVMASLLLIPGIMPVLEANYMLILAGAALVAFFSAGYYTEMRWFYLYGVVMASLFTMSSFLLLALYLPFLVMGVISLCVGGFQLIRFLLKYPNKLKVERVNQ
jgi:hypothetical protein